MKWIIKKITGIAIFNFMFLLFATTFIPLQKPQDAPKAVSVVSVSSNNQIAVSIPTPTSVRNIFAELDSHNTKGNCWIGYRGHVYDITSVFGTHPGGDGTMLKYCGSDATAGFDSKDRSPAMPHSASAVGLLAQYLIQ